MGPLEINMSPCSFSLNNNYCTWKLQRDHALFGRSISNYFSNSLRKQSCALGDVCVTVTEVDFVMGSTQKQGSR